MLSRLDILRGLRISIWEGVWATVWMALTTGPFQTGFALHLGATPVQLGLLAGLPAAVNLLQIPAAAYVERRGERRVFCGVSSVLGRLLWIPILLIPFLVPHAAQLTTFLLLLTLSSALLTIVMPAWSSWMSDLVPATSRGDYFGRRNMYAGIVAMLAPLPAGAFLDQAVKYGRFDPRIGFAVLFGVASIAAVAAFLMILSQPEPPMMHAAVRENPLKAAAAPLSDKKFVSFLAFSALAVLSQSFAGQFFMTWQLDKTALNLPYLTVQILGASAAGSGLAMTPIWGYLSDKYGSRPVLMMASAVTIFAPLLWCLTIPNLLWWNIGVIILLNLLSGAAWAGVGLTQFNMLLNMSDAARRATYVAVFSAITGLVGFASPILGGAAMNALSHVHLSLGFIDFNNYKLLFLMTAFIRIGMLFQLRTVRTTEESHSTRYVLDQLASARPISSYFAARRLSRPSDAIERRQTAEDLGNLRSPLAVEELTNALEDVSLEVREQAAESLGSIGDSRAIAALGEKMGDPAAGIGELCAHALGKIGDRQATPYLVAAAQGPDAGVRVAAIRALAELADPDALPALVIALTPQHPTACEAACQALASLGGTLTLQQIAPILPRLLYLLSPEVERGMRFAAARTLGSLSVQAAGLPETYLTLRSRTISEEDTAVLAQEALALSRIGKQSHQDIDELLNVLIPALDRAGIGSLAYKQILQAISDLLLPSGALYPYLSLREMARDEAVNRLLNALRRDSPDQFPAEDAARLIDAFATADYATFLQLLSPIVPKDNVAFQRFRERAENGYGTPEESLLVLLLIRR
jgi:HEAT repeat protein/nitrate/nitrite transporter NarK